MKIAIFHNYMDNIGGAEIVDLILAREFGADIYTTNIDFEKIKKMGFDENNIFSIGKIPINAPYRQQLAYYKFKKLNLKDKYDLYFIAGDWAMSAGINNKPNLWYVYSPVREIWDLYEYTRHNTVPFLKRPLFDAWVYYHRSISRNNIKHINRIISISDNVRKRVKRYFGRDSTVIYPPVQTSKFKYKKNGDYWLSVNRLIHHKRVDLQLKAFLKIPNEKLIVVGSYEKAKHFQAYVEYIKKIKPDNVEIVSWVEFDDLVDLYANCKGFIATSKDEDFGMNAIEALASGKPVIAVNEGGYKETVIDNVTGRLINADESSLIKAIKYIGINPKEYKNRCIKQAKKFDIENFIRKIKTELLL